MFNWSEIGMFSAGFLFGTFYWWKQIVGGLRWESHAKQAVRNQAAIQLMEKK